MKLSLLKLLSLAALVCLIGCGGGDDNPADNNDNNSANNGGNSNNNNNNNGGGGGTSDYVELGGLKWMKKNLNIEAGNSWCYDNDPANCETYGRLYDWATAKTVCPTGWKLPDNDDWNSLRASVGGRDVSGKALKSKSGWYQGGNGTDSYGFSALPSGARVSESDPTFAVLPFVGITMNGMWWTATEKADNDQAAVRRIISFNSDADNFLYDSKDMGLSVRCVKQ